MKRMVAVMVGLVLVCGCVGLTPEQRADLGAYQELVQGLGGRLSEYGKRIEAVALAVEAGKIPWDEGRELVEAIEANRKADLAAVEDAKVKLRELREQDIPWVTIAWYTLLGAAGGGGGLAALIKRWMQSRLTRTTAVANMALGVNDAIIRGVEEGEKDYTKIISDILTRLTPDERKKFDEDYKGVPVIKVVKLAVNKEADKRHVAADVADAVVDVLG